MKKSVQHILFGILALFCIVFIYVAFNIIVLNNDTNYTQHYLDKGNSYFDTGNYEYAKKQYIAYKLYNEWDGSEKQQLAERCVILLKEAELCFSEKNYELAKNKYKEISNINPKDNKVKSKISICNEYICASLLKEANKNSSNNYKLAKNKYKEIVQINPKSPKSEQLVYASVKRTPSVWLEHDVFVNGYRGMKIYVSFGINNMIRQEGKCVAYFENEYGNALIDTGNFNDSYGSAGKVTTSAYFTPSSNDYYYKDFILGIPYFDLHLPSGKHKLRLIVKIYSSNNKCIAQTDYIYFFVNR